mmetsp:Transcript_16125/g.21325  ORF Transcript_16125/g.21325 Transcript_16125/m.21325 type:complete len:82 (+) Transcript_16125:1611-1856(+)
MKSAGKVMLNLLITILIQVIWGIVGFVFSGNLWEASESSIFDLIFQMVCLGSSEKMMFHQVEGICFMGIPFTAHVLFSLAH